MRYEWGYMGDEGCWGFNEDVCIGLMLALAGHWYRRDMARWWGVGMVALILSRGILIALSFLEILSNYMNRILFFNIVLNSLPWSVSCNIRRYIPLSYAYRRAPVPNTIMLGALSQIHTILLPTWLILVLDIALVSLSAGPFLAVNPLNFYGSLPLEQTVSSTAHRSPPDTAESSVCTSYRFILLWLRSSVERSVNVQGMRPEVGGIGCLRDCVVWHGYCRR